MSLDIPQGVVDSSSNSSYSSPTSDLESVGNSQDESDSLVATGTRAPSISGLTDNKANPENTSGFNSPLESPGQLGKRKREFDVVRHPSKHAKQRKHFNHSYALLYNSSVEDAASRFATEAPWGLPSSQIGITRWNSEEKNIVFNALARLGKDAIRDISVAVGTKSEIEVHEYLMLLRDGLVQHNLKDAQLQLLAPRDFSIAVELSEECCQNLEVIADAMAWSEYRKDCTIEEKRHGKYWLLNPEISLEIEEQIHSNKDQASTNSMKSPVRFEPVSTEPKSLGASELDETMADEQQVLQPCSAVPAAQLLNLATWLRLSTDIFMNSGSSNMENNWQSIAEFGEEPSMFHTAFEDFYRVTVSLTKRLVSASIFHAEARIRSHKEMRASRRYGNLVRSKDVRNAIDVLGLRHNSDDFWVKVPRRCGLQVYHSRPLLRRQASSERPLAYSEVEKILGGDDRTSRHESIIPPDTRSDLLPTESIVDDSSISPFSDESGVEYNSDQSIPREKDHELDLELWERQEKYLALVDQNSSRKEEKKLWEILGQAVPPNIDLSSPELPKMPPVERRNQNDLIDWRERIDYQPEWRTLRDMVNSEPAFFEQPQRDISDDQGSLSLIQHTPVDQAAGIVEHPTPIKAPSLVSTKGKLKKPSSKAFEVSNSTHSTAGINQTSLDSPPARRTLEPRRAREVATSSIGQLPLIQHDDDSSIDDFNPHDINNDSESP